MGWCRQIWEEVTLGMEVRLDWGEYKQPQEFTLGKRMGHPRME